MTAATAAPVARLVRSWEAVMASRSPGFFLYKLTPEEGAGFLLWTNGGCALSALVESHKLVACCPSTRYEHWKAVQTILKEALGG